MKIAVVYDSKFEQIEQVVGSLAAQISSAGHEVKIFSMNESKPSDLEDFEPEFILVR